MIYQTAVITQQGGRLYNEDSLGHLGLDDGFGCWVVADGLGGHGGGDVASQLAVETILAGFKDNPLVTSDRLNGLFEQAQSAIIAQQKVNLTLNEMQTTGVVLLVAGNEALWGHVGDSRLYYFSAGQLQKQTCDHSVPQLLVKAGEIEIADIRFHEDRNRLLRSIGGVEDVRPFIEKQTIETHSGDAFLLCTDGFWEYVFEDEMVTDLNQSDNADRWLDLMVQRLQTRAPEHNDNYSAITIRVS